MTAPQRNCYIAIRELLDRYSMADIEFSLKVAERESKNNPEIDAMSDDKVTVQVKVPVCVTLTMDRDFAGWTDHEELCRYVDEVLRREQKRNIEMRGMVLMAPKIQQGVEMTYGISPHWDYLPMDDCEIVTSEEGLFPNPDADQYGGMTMKTELENPLISATNLIAEAVKELPPGYSLELSFSSEECSADLFDFDGHEVHCDVESNESVISTAIRAAKEHTKLFGRGYGIDI